MSQEAVPQGNFEFREKMKAVAEQLRKPSGEFGLKVAENMNVSNKEMYDLLFENLQIPAQSNLLEIGFGNGLFFPQYVKINPSVKLYGVDFSEDMCRLAAEKNEELVTTEKLEILCSDAKTLPFEDQFLDVIVTLNTIYFWENPVDYFEEIKRVLKKEGKLYLCFRPMHVMKNYEFTQHGFSFFEMDEVLKTAEQAGLKCFNHKSITYPKKNITGQDVNSTDICLILNK